MSEHGPLERRLIDAISQDADSDAPAYADELWASIVRTASGDETQPSGMLTLSDSSEVDEGAPATRASTRPWRLRLAAAAILVAMGVAVTIVLDSNEVVQPVSMGLSPACATATNEVEVSGLPTVGQLDAVIDEQEWADPVEQQLALLRATLVQIEAMTASADASIAATNRTRQLAERRLAGLAADSVQFQSCMQVEGT